MDSCKSGWVSVIIPTYNREVYLREAIQSVRAQTYRPIECIVIDDGSTDNTKAVLEEIAKTVDKNFKLLYIFQENSGSQVARNTGTKASMGEYIQYLDSDDLLYPEKLEKQVAFFRENEECDGVWGGWAKGLPEKNELIESIAGEDLLTQFLTEHCIVNFSFLFRKTIVEKIGDWDINIRRNQEIDFQVRGLLEGGNYRYQPQICGLWRTHDGERIASTTGSKEFLNFYHKWENMLSQKGLLNERMKQNISNTYVWLAWENSKSLNEKKVSINLLKEAFRINPLIPFANTKKMKFLRKFFPLRPRIKLWWFWAKKNR